MEREAKRYVALLRGVNVGGKNIISMPLLKIAFEEAGFMNVRTYINSGNILFASNEDNIATLQQICKQIIINRFQINTPVVVLSAQELLDAVDNAPEWWGRDNESKHNAIFIIAPAMAKDIIAQVGETKPEYENVAHYGRVIFWSAPQQTFSRTRWSKIVSTDIYGSITIRNANTTKKLVQIIRSDDMA